MLLCVLFLWGCSGEKKKTSADLQAAPEKTTPVAAASVHAGDPASGKAIYLRYCHFCHGRKGMGDGPVGIAISPHPADFVHDTKRMNKTDAELFESITKGIHKTIGGEEMAMPRWKEILSEQERWDVLSYVRKLEHEGRAAEKKK
ncbi:MAG: c-type cytochrome [Thermodesulfobacteriota bacterium]